MSYNQHRQYQSYKRNKHHNQTYQTAQIRCLGVAVNENDKEKTND